ncbi:surface carbohydrate biosynthesis protein [Arboricoccus pini]|uniref:Surface carbohydrate biosynthesis protein n=1 Tax=Arboricoccus pini TaxID=1963835 RepID=A0A212RDP1_9PROT|nr:surface carbohydrate biosynthesis protein [Arboricoccus pini]SNB70367.1 surface carbohydrate biosynthesis protein [Arboricoccus pini]
MTLPSSRPLVVLPIEIRNRELDGMLLLGAVLAERGHPVLMGNRQSLIRRHASLPPAILLGKTVQQPDAEVYSRWREAGHRIAVLDEEGLITYSTELYLRRRVHVPTMTQADMLLAWGPEHARIWEGVEMGLPRPPVRAVGNARFDLLRAELRGAHADAAAAIRARLGPFILFNSNFAAVNAFTPEQNRLPHPDELARAGQTPPPYYDPGLARYRHRLFAAYKEALPAIARRFPNHRLVVRPHPAECPDAWRQSLTGLPNAHVVYEDAAQPWIMAATQVIHHSCTTAVEAYLMGRPALSYRPVENDAFDPLLTGVCSERVRDLDTLLARLDACLSGDTPRADPMARELVAHRLTGMKGILAADRIADALAELPPPRLDLNARISRWRWHWHELRKEGPETCRSVARLNAHFYPPEEAGAALVDLQARLHVFSRLLGRFAGVDLGAAPLGPEAPQTYWLRAHGIVAGQDDDLAAGTMEADGLAAPSHCIKGLTAQRALPLQLGRRRAAGSRPA